LNVLTIGIWILTSFSQLDLNFSRSSEVGNERTRIRRI
jgi:hypothetical protein